MGMAASQARLLTITSRMHDVEYKAQNIESQKIELATQKDQVYNNYLEALDKTKIQVGYENSTTGGVRYVDANFNNVCTYQEGRKQQYALKDSKTGKVIVDKNTYDTYNDWSADKYSFAWAMLGFCQFGCGDRINDGGYIGNAHQVIEDYDMVEMTEVEKYVYNELAESHPTLKNAYENWQEVSKNGTDAEKREALEHFRSELYGSNDIIKRIYEIMSYGDNGGFQAYDSIEEVVEANKSTNVEDLDNFGEFNYYVRLFENIDNSGGCISIDAICEDGENGADWFNNNVNSGNVIIEMYNPKGTQKGWVETSVATSTNENHLQEVKDDAAVKKAEAIYEHELSIINSKDTKFDKELSKLETERSALKTEMDAIKQVKEDNIERTFGIFS